MAQAPVMVMNTNAKRETGREAQKGNINAATAVSGIVRSTMGPRAMLKMLLDPMGGIVITNDGNCILREVDVSHPTAKSMIELARAQDEEVGDGTTSVIVLAGEVLQCAGPLIERNLHPTVIVAGYTKALVAAIKVCDALATPLDVHDSEKLLQLVAATIGTKFSARMGTTVIDLAVAATLKVVVDKGDRKEVDIKRYARVEKIPGGELDDCQVLEGVMFNKDITHPKMRRKIENPRIVLLDCPLEYKKGESSTNVEIDNDEDWDKLLRMEEEYVENLCNCIIAVKPDIVITEKGVSDLAQHYFLKAGITAIRRLRKSDNNRVARATGATIVNRFDEIQDSDVGTGCGVFEVKKIGDEYFCFLEKCKDPKACTILLRGGSKDVLNEVERNLMDCMQVVRNVVLDPRLLPGGGATEMAIAVALKKVASEIDGVHKLPVLAVAKALEVIPRTLAENAGANIVRVLTQLRSKHSDGNHRFGIDGDKGTIVDMAELGIWEPYSVKTQAIKTALESATMILRIDDIVSGMKHKP